MGLEQGTGAADSEPIDCLGFGSDSDGMCSGVGSNRGAAELDLHCDAGDGTEVCQGVHYYVDVPNREESAYAACERNVQIDLGFHHHL